MYQKFFRGKKRPPKPIKKPPVTYWLSGGKNELVTLLGFKPRTF